MIPCKDIVKISKEKTALVIPNAIQICTTRDEKYNFTSFTARDKTFLVLERVRKCTAEDQVSPRCLLFDILCLHHNSAMIEKVHMQCFDWLISSDRHSGH